MSAKNGGSKKKPASSSKKNDKELKRPLSAYQIFLADIRPDLAAKGLKTTEVLKEGAKQWKKLKDKSEYEQRAAEAKEKYYKKHPKPIKVEVPKEKQRARSGYNIFFSEVKDQYKGQKEWVAQIGALWTNLSEEEKEKYEEMAKDEKESMAQELATRRGVELFEFGAGADID